MYPSAIIRRPSGRFRYITAFLLGLIWACAPGQLKDGFAPPPGNTSLVILPHSVAVAPRDTVQFYALDVDSQGDTNTALVDWTAAAGTISANGRYVADSTPGTYKVTGKHKGNGNGNGKNADTVTVVVVSPTATLTSLSLTPATASVPAGGSLSYTVTALWSDGSTTPPPLTWQAAGGHMVGSIYFADSTLGTYRVIVSANGGAIADTAAVTITAPPPVLRSVTLTPATVSLAPGGAQAFSVAALWSDGSTTLPALTWQATGGTMSGSTYTAGSTGGTYRVVVSAASGTVADTASVTITTAAATLVSLTLTPGSVTLPAGASQPFTVAARWSDGSTTLPSLAWQATGGQMSGSTYLAGPTTGNYQVVVSAASGTVADTAPVTITPAGPTPTPWIEENFSTYTSTADMMADPRGLYGASPNPGTDANISLDTSQGYGGLTQSMKYTWPDRSNDPNLCSDYTVGRNLDFPTDVQEVWVEIYVRFSPNFATFVSSCTGQSNADYKMLFGRVVNPNTDRFQIKVGTFGDATNVEYPDYTGPSGPPSLKVIADGNWHRFRAHWKVVPGGAPLGRCVVYLDNTLVKDYGLVPIDRGGISGLGLGRNMNQGPIQVQSMNWGRIRVWTQDPSWGW